MNLSITSPQPGSANAFAADPASPASNAEAARFAGLLSEQRQRLDSAGGAYRGSAFDVPAAPRAAPAPVQTPAPAAPARFPAPAAEAAPQTPPVKSAAKSPPTVKSAPAPKPAPGPAKPDAERACASAEAGEPSLDAAASGASAAASPPVDPEAVTASATSPETPAPAADPQALLDWLNRHIGAPQRSGERSLGGTATDGDAVDGAVVKPRAEGDAAGARRPATALRDRAATEARLVAPAPAAAAAMTAEREPLATAASPRAAETEAARPVELPALTPIAHAAPAVASPQGGPLPVALATPVTSPDFSQALAAQLTTLASQGVHEAELQLNPAEMGPIAVQIVLDGSQAQIDFSAAHAATRQALEDSLPSLAAALHGAGLTLSGGGVFEQRSGARDGQAAEGDGPGRGRRGGPGGLAAAGGSTSTVRLKQSQGLLDTYA